MQVVDIEDGVPMVQIDEYLPKRCYRMSDGRWRLENPYVVFEQKTFIPADELPLFDLIIPSELSTP